MGRRTLGLAGLDHLLTSTVSRGVYVASWLAIASIPCQEAMAYSSDEDSDTDLHVRWS